MRYLLSASIVGLTLSTGCFYEDKDPVVVEKQSEPQVIKEREVVREQPVVIERETKTETPPPTKVEINTR